MFSWQRNALDACLPACTLLLLTLDLASFPQETEREAIIADGAMQDGSSYVCSCCGGVVPVRRREHHQQFWCQPPRP